MNQRFTPNEIQSFKNILEKAQKVAIVTHHRPDGDAVGSSLGLHLFLKSMGIQSGVILPDDCPDFLKWMPAFEDVLIHVKHHEVAEKVIHDADIVFWLDFNQSSRTNSLQQAIDAAGGTKVLIDHHLAPDPGPEFVFSYTDASSTAELIFQFIVALGNKEKVNHEIANCLLAGIITDTGSFRFPSTSPETHRVAAALVALGAQSDKIHENIFDNFSVSRMHLLGFSLANRLKVFPEYKVSYVYLSQQDLDKHGYHDGDTEGLVNFALAIKGIEMAVLFTERDQIVRISLRSKGDLSVQSIARKYFNGGGHKNASGGSSELSMDETVKKFETMMPDIKNHYLKS